MMWSGGCLEAYIGWVSDVVYATAAVLVVGAFCWIGQSCSLALLFWVCFRVFHTRLGKYHNSPTLSLHMLPASVQIVKSASEVLFVFLQAAT